LFEVTANGLATQMASSPEQNFVTVCGQPCLFSDASTASVAKCSVPAISTTYSNSNFKIENVSEDLKPAQTFGTNANHALVFDNNLLNNAGDTTAADCTIGAEFRDGFVGLISQVRWFMSDIADKSVFNATTKFQGSNDGATYSDLFTFDDNLHEGWNYHKWEDAQEPKYRFYRFTGASAGSCNINEIKFTGVETIESSQAT
jgi:hypothetical protein